jgi:ribonuclease HII
MSVKQTLQKYFTEDPNVFEIGVDEAGRGPLFGRVYAAAVVLPKDDSFDHSKVKDSKLFTSKKKIGEAAEYIKANALAWSVRFESEDVVDKINILQATQQAMRHAVLDTIKQYDSKRETREKYHLLIDGNYFKPISLPNAEGTKLEVIDFDTVTGGDNKFSSIAAASILAKVSRDQYILDLCEEYPELVTNYGLDGNKGYGAKVHLDGIKQHGITQWHRKTFGICKSY